MKQKYLNIFALSAGLSAILVITFYLTKQYNEPIFFTEPINFVRNTEIIIGLISMPILAWMIGKEVIR